MPVQYEFKVHCQGGWATVTAPSAEARDKIRRCLEIGLLVDRGLSSIDSDWSLVRRTPLPDSQPACTRCEE